MESKKGLFDTIYTTNLMRLWLRAPPSMKISKRWTARRSERAYFQRIRYGISFRSLLLPEWEQVR